MKAHNFIDLKGRRFSRLSVEGYAGKNRSGHTLWQCLCDCGRYALIPTSNLTRKHTRSCGCYRTEIAMSNGLRNKRHGEARHGQETREFKAYIAMHGRCKNDPGYVERRIWVCGRWNGRDGFLSFLKDMGRCPDGYSLDRINVNGSYEPSNCRWADAKTQRANQRKRARLDQFSTSELEVELTRRNTAEQASFEASRSLLSMHKETMKTLEG